MCGGTAGLGAGLDRSTGLSPRVRGNPPAFEHLPRFVGSIPACAGEPRRKTKSMECCRVYPRVCGGTQRGFAFPGVRTGIPACAGEPPTVGPPALGEAVYPRVCGGTDDVFDARTYRVGLSPRVRGNHRADDRADGPPGSIPACAGEPAVRYTREEPTVVYPRVCGGTVPVVVAIEPREGLSPRVRGNLHHQLRFDHSLGSIPACAGEPVQRRPRQGACAGEPNPLTLGQRVEVYPRVCGGTPNAGYPVRASLGLSPRVRGNPR